MSGTDTGRHTTEMNDLKTLNERFYAEVLQGLSSYPKRLSSKYFYDAAGDDLFRQIMSTPEYYLTKCEMEILREQSDDIVKTCVKRVASFDVVELGPGDASKSVYLLRSLLKEEPDFTYYPVDISSNVIRELETILPRQVPSLNWKGLNGEYLAMLQQLNEISQRRRLVLFMGANIGNFKPEDAEQFLGDLHKCLLPGDLLLTGFDLKKNPFLVLAAYNDKQGITKAFNLNLLHRINRELNANFKTAQFDHFPTYDPVTGACRSFLISLQNQIVRIGDAVIHFAENEPIQMEISQKYTADRIDLLAAHSGFRPVAKFYDSRKWFLDSLWTI